MQIGDRVRDTGTQFVGTIIQFDPPTGEAVRCLIEADNSNTTGVGKVGDPPADKLWQSVGKVELIDLAGNRVAGSPGTTLNTAGKRVDAAGNVIDTPMGGNFDSAGNRIKPGSPLDTSATGAQRKLDAKSAAAKSA